MEQHAALLSESTPDPPYYTKEVHFLDRNDRYVRGLSWYSSYFPNCSSNVIAIDATPNYFSNEGQPQGDEYWHRLYNTYNASLNPGWEEQMVFIVVFRDPATRFLSAFKHLYVRDKGIAEKHSFPMLTKAVADSTKTCSLNYTMATCQGGFGHDMLRKGYYAELLGRWINTFPASTFLLSTMDEVKRSPEHLLEKIAQTAGSRVTDTIPDKKGGQKIIRNHGVDLHLSEAGARIEKEALQELKRFYAPLNIKFWSQLVLLLRQNRHVSYFGRLLTLGTS